MAKVIDLSNEQNVEPFKTNSAQFVAAAMERIAEQNTRLEESIAIFQRTKKFYKFQPDKGSVDECKPKEFFNEWLPFVKDFREAWKKEFDAINWEM